MNQLYIKNDDRILIIAPHPDDESIGCGGLISMYPAQCEILVMTDGSQGDKNICPEEMGDIRREEFVSAMRLARIDSYRLLNYPDGELILHPECLQDVNLQAYTKIMIPHHREAHADHKAVFHFLVDAIQRHGAEHIELWQYETREAINEAAYYLDISDYADQKKNLIGQYQSQIKGYDYVAFTESLMAYRACRAGEFGKYLEAYIPLDPKEDQEQTVRSSEEDGQLSRLLSEYRRNNDILDCWLRLKLAGRGIGEYLADRYEDVAVYGYGYFGRLLYRDLEGKLPIRFVIDRNADKLYKDNIRFILPEYKEDIDLVIISNMFGREEIKKEMKAYGYRAVVTLWDILIQMRENEEASEG